MLGFFLAGNFDSQIGLFYTAKTLHLGKVKINRTDGTMIINPSGTRQRRKRFGVRLKAVI